MDGNGKASGPVVGFIGLGRMGGNIAANLLAAGTDLVVCDLSAAARKPLVEAGAAEAATLADLAAKADVIFTCLPGPKEFEAVVLGPEGLLSHLRKGTVLLDLSTNSRETILKAHEALAAHGCHLLDAPISGGPAGARTRELVIWVGGARAHYDAVLPLLEAAAKYPMHVGPTGAGAVTKLAHNMLGMTLMRAQAEAFALAVKGGLEPLAFWKALRFGSVGRQSVLFMLHQQFLINDYEDPVFALSLAHKDVGLAIDMARQLGVPTALADDTYADLDAAVKQGLAGKDTRVFLKQQLDRAGVEIEVDRKLVAEAVEEARRQF